MSLTKKILQELKETVHIALGKSPSEIFRSSGNKSLMDMVVGKSGTTHPKTEPIPLRRNLRTWGQKSNYGGTYKSHPSVSNIKELKLKTIIEDIIVSTTDLMGIPHIGFDMRTEYYYETMVFAPGWELFDDQCYRWETYTQACQGHEMIVEKIKEQLRKVCGYCSTRRENHKDVLCPRCGGQYE